ncbi:MAG: NAD(P)H-dependent oxidoreductase [Nanobdellota archaeon]
MTLIIYAHPDHEGHNGYYLDTIKNKIKGKYQIIDLYKDNFNPKLKYEEHYVHGRKKISEKNLDFQKKIKQSEKLIFIFPIWWGSMPAILKGFFDRVFTPGFAFNFSKKGFPIKHLKEKKAVVFTSAGSPLLYSKIFQASAYNQIKKHILGFSGIKSKIFSVYNSKKLNKEQKSKIEKNIEKGLKWLE